MAQDNYVQGVNCLAKSYNKSFNITSLSSLIYSEIPNVIAPSEFSINFWVRAHKLGTAQMILFLSEGEDWVTANFAFSIGHDGRMEIFVNGLDLRTIDYSHQALINGQLNSSFLNSTPIDTNIFYNLTVIYKSNIVYLYLNGELNAQYNNVTTEVGTVNSNIIIGNCPDPNPPYIAYPVVSDLDEMRFYSRALTENEVQVLYNTNSKVTKCNCQNPNGLLAYYPFNGNANDESGNGYNGVVKGATLTTDRCGNPNSAYYFDGISNNISVLSDSFYLQNYTYSVWFKPDQYPVFGDGAYILSIGGDGADQNICLVNSYNGFFGLACSGYNDPETPPVTKITTGSVLPELGEWYFLVSVRSDDSLGFYINGHLYSMISTNSTLPLYTKNSSSHFMIGSRFNSSQFTSGTIDDIRIFNQVLDSCEIASLYYTDCEYQKLGAINGITEVCQGKKNVEYNVSNMDSIISYSWNYSGIGANIINGNSDSISIDFDNNATSGILKVTGYGNDGKIKDTAELSITVNPLPSDAGFITGDNIVCINQNLLSYNVPPINNASNYNWLYSGTGATILNNSDNIEINFSQNATSGYLTVSGINACGIGNSSKPFFIELKNCTIFEIAGETSACQGQNGVSYYALPKDSLINYYTWNYSGIGAIILGNSNNILIDFANNATSGILKVTGYGNDGKIKDTAEISITINSKPDAASIINGDNNVCSNQDGFNYNILPIDNASNYVWQFSGNGATIIGNSDNIIMNFNKNATNGYLTVSGNNTCGSGTKSPEFAIMVDSCNQGNSGNFYIPNSFSPNGDNINDFFYIKGLTANSKLIVFDRFGKILFESLNYQNNWDGKDNKGNVLNSGTYWYVLTIPGFPTEFKGYVYLKK